MRACVFEASVGVRPLMDYWCPRRSASFKEDEGTWKGNDDGKVVNNQPQRVMDDRNGLGPQGGYIAKITNDARESEMEENMGQVNTMIGNLRNMAIDMGSELENQNRQIDRINRKVRKRFARVRRRRGVSALSSCKEPRNRERSNLALFGLRVCFRRT